MKIALREMQTKYCSTPSWQLWQTKFGARPLHRRIAERCCRTIRSAVIPLLDKPFVTDFSKRAFQSSAPTVWNSLPQTVLISDSLSVFKSRIKTFLFNQAFTEHWSDLPPVPLKLRPYGTIEIRLLLLLTLCAGCSKVEPKIFTLLQTPSRGHRMAKI